MEAVLNGFPPKLSLKGNFQAKGGGVREERDYYFGSDSSSLSQRMIAELPQCLGKEAVDLCHGFSLFSIS